MTRLRDTYFAAFGRRSAPRLRAALVIAYIAVSVAVVIVVTAMTAALSQPAKGVIDSFVGSLVVSPKPPSQQGANAPRGLRDSDVEALEENADPSLIRQIVPVVNGRAVVGAGDGGDRDYGSIGIVGSNSGYLQLRRMTLVAGSMFTQEQYENKARVALIGPKLVSYLFDGDTQAAIGSKITVGRQKFEVIGVTSGDGQDNDTVLIPLTSSRSFLYGNKDNVVAIGAQAASLDSLDAAQRNVESILDRAHYVKEPDQRDFTITSFTYLVPFLKPFLGIPRWLAVGGLVALLVVGIFGLAKLMLITVAERRARIRYRRWAGASAGKIIGEVLVGSTVIAGLGAVIGIALGVAAIVASWEILPHVSALFALAPPRIPVEAILLAFVTCLLMGLVSGAFPAIRAARIPVGGGRPDRPECRAAVEPS